MFLKVLYGVKIFSGLLSSGLNGFDYIRLVRVIPQSLIIFLEYTKPRKEENEMNGGGNFVLYKCECLFFFLVKMFFNGRENFLRMLLLCLLLLFLQMNQWFRFLDSTSRNIHNTKDNFSLWNISQLLLSNLLKYTFSLSRRLHTIQV